MKDHSTKKESSEMESVEDSLMPVPTLETQIQPLKQPMLQQQPSAPPTNEKRNETPHKQHSGNGGGIMTTDMDVRSWFEGLSSGEDRAASMTVSDPAFIGMLMSMVVCDNDSSSSSTQVTTATASSSTAQQHAVPTTTLSNKTAKAKDLAEAYEALEEFHHSHQVSRSQGPLNESSSSPDSNNDQEGSSSASNMNMIKNGNEVTNHKASTKGKESSKCSKSNIHSSLTTSISTSTSSCTSKKNTQGESSVVQGMDSDAFRIQGELSNSSNSLNSSNMTKKGTKNNNDSNQVQPSTKSSSFGDKKNEGDSIKPSLSSLSSSSSTNNTNGNNNNNNKTSTTSTPQLTTLHFKSGLSLTISSDSESSKKVIASAGKMTSVPTTLPILPKLESHRNIINRQNDVDSLLHFSALNLPSKNKDTTTTTITATTTNNSKDDQGQGPHNKKINHIIQSKIAASRAMSLQTTNSSYSSSSSSSTTLKAGENLLQHICLVFTSALGLMANPTGGKPSTSNSKVDSKMDNEKDQIEFLTVDPMYLKKDAESDEMKFLIDADSIIDYELKKLGKTTDGIENNNNNNNSNNTTTRRFLNGATRIQSDTTSNSESKEILHPEWFQHFNESDDTCIPATIVLLARIEQAIRESHQICHMSKSSISNDDLNLVTPPSTPSNQERKGNKNNTLETVNSSEDGSTTDNFLTPCEKSSDDRSSSEAEDVSNYSSTSPEPSQKQRPPRFLSTSNVKNDNNFTDFLGSWKNFQQSNSHNDVVKNVKNLIRGKTTDQCNSYAEKVLQSFSLKDLLLVPICSVLLIQPPASKLGVNQTLAYIRLLVNEWSKIITAGLTKVQKDLAKQQLLELDDSLVAEFDLLMDDDAVAKPGNGKKKKRKKKKKKKKANNSNNTETQEGKSNIIDSVPSRDSLRRSNDDVKDCALSTVSSVSIATEASKQILSSPSNTTLPVSHVGNMNGAVVGSSRLEETDDQSSDGWETVEPKGGRSKRLAALAKVSEKQTMDATPSAPQSPNSRRNKGKSKSRQRAKQKPKEKEQPKRTVEPLEEGIAKRGTNTIKALMEERNKRPTDDSKNSKPLTEERNKRTSDESKNSNDHSKQVSGRSSIADQNTAQTIPESLSGVSTAPVQTLVGPGNNNSASSSVASSLEAPHATRHKPHHHHDSCKEDDVGYHLLKVCERLSADMNAFMRRRASALAVRRRERGALLAALQDSVQNVWAGQCHVEMYGSCSTGLDLPSSDLDVVIRGLDGSENLYIPQPPAGVDKNFTRDHSSSSDIRSNSIEIQDPNMTQSTLGVNAAQRPYTNYPNFYPPLTPNGNRVVRLAAELERQPWAVQVKAIPTASVPVIKILSDPSRLPGAASGIDWVLHQQQMAAAADMKMAAGAMPPNNPNFPNTQPLQWRGADIMNGLLSLDITFEGPEHGGICSTNYSASVVQDVVSETGLPPDSTPAVQVTMVIKELLAQRRLNEPFSGGLSSYAILLLVVAVLKEREFIRDEIERVEKQKQAVAAENTAAKTENKPQNTLPKKSSWAAIAKKTSATKEENESSKQQNKLPPKIAQPTKSQTTQKPAQQQSQEEENKSSSENQSICACDSTPFPQGSNDVLEVLCSGEATAGKLFMHFLMFYGKQFDPKTTCIDVTGSRHPEYNKIKNDPRRKWSPFMNRKPGGSYNPVTDVYTVDPVVVYDPTEDDYNVTRSSYAFPNVAWTFLQCYNTLSGVVEVGSEGENDRREQTTKTGQTPRQSESTQKAAGAGPNNEQVASNSPSSNNGLDTTARNIDTELSPLLELLLSF